MGKHKKRTIEDRQDSKEFKQVTTYPNIMRKKGWCSNPGL
jgi:hypothetical protein